jgi:membrane peptidoglycan carboxypeptidase
MSIAWRLAVTVVVAVASSSLAWAAPLAEGAGGTVSVANAGSPELASSRRVRLETIARSGRGYVAQLEGGARAELTLDPRLQDAAEDVLRDFRVPYGAAVVI